MSHLLVLVKLLRLSSQLLVQVYLFMVNNLVQVALELCGQQDCLKAPGGDATPVKVLHPQSASQLQLRTVQEVCVAHYR